MRKLIESIIEQALSLDRRVKRIIIFTLDIVTITFSYYFSLVLLRSNLSIGFSNLELSHLILVLSSSILLLQLSGFYTAVTRFVSFSILLTAAMGSLMVGCLHFIFGYLLSANHIDLSSSIIFSLLLCVSLGGSRLVVRAYFSSRLNTEKKRIIIYGAGSAGRQLATSLIAGNEYYPVAFMDDEVSLDGVVIQGIRVYSAGNLKKVVNLHNAEKVLLALPSISRAQRKLIIGRIERAGVAVQTIPGMADIISGKMKIDEFQDVDIEDLLGRDPVPPIQDLLDKNIRNKAVMVTGAGGSIGSELCRQIVQLQPTTLVLFEISEFALYQINKELTELCQQYAVKIPIKPILGSVVDRDKVGHVMSHFKVNTLYHAAAYKHVPMVEHNVIEGITNNVFGTMNTALGAMGANVESFVLISTDKAVRPTNVMGASKRVAELVLQGLATKESNTCFSMVRFGNVLGSSGSVVPLFKRQIKSGGPVTVTHPDITRYFMTIPEAAQLVIQAGAMGKGGDVFVLDMGEPVRIVELAEKLILLMGLEVKSEDNPEGDIEINFTGLRPGEKLYEELLVGNNVQGTQHPRIMTASEVFLPWVEIEDYLNKLLAACDTNAQQKIRNILISMPVDFSPSDGISDLLWMGDDASSNNIVNIPSSKF